MGREGGREGGGCYSSLHSNIADDGFSHLFIYDVNTPPDDI